MIYDPNRVRDTSPQRAIPADEQFTSCCTTQSGNLMHVRVRETRQLMRPADVPLVRRSLHSDFDRFVEQTDAARSVLHVDAQILTADWLHTTLWRNGCPSLIGMFIRDIRELGGLEAVGWFAREHDLPLRTFLAFAREVREADENLPLLITFVRAHSEPCFQQLQTNWEILEHVTWRCRAWGMTSSVEDLSPALRTRVSWRQRS